MSLPPPTSSTAARRAARRVGSIGLALFACGCSLLSGPTVQPTRFYVLDSVSEPETAGRRMTIGLGPVTMPPYLERPEMVVRVAENRLVLDEFNRWSEPLKANFVRVLATDLDHLLGLERLVAYPWYSTTPIDYAISIAVLRFEPQPTGEVVLRARWAISDGRGGVLLNRDSNLQQPGGSPDERAAAMSNLTGALASDIAAALREQDTQKR